MQLLQQKFMVFLLFFVNDAISCCINALKKEVFADPGSP